MTQKSWWELCFCQNIKRWFYWSEIIDGKTTRGENNSMGICHQFPTTMGNFPSTSHQFPTKILIGNDGKLVGISEIGDKGGGGV